MSDPLGVPPLQYRAESTRLAALRWPVPLQDRRHHLAVGRMSVISIRQRASSGNGRVGVVPFRFISMASATVRSVSGRPLTRMNSPLRSG